MRAALRFATLAIASPFLAVGFMSLILTAAILEVFDDKGPK